MDVKIIKFEECYRDDMLFCYLLAKDALGRIPQFRDDLLDIKSNYFDKGDMFWLAIDENNRVVGMLGSKTTSAQDMWLKRLFIKPNFKGHGIGTMLLREITEFAKTKGLVNLHTQFPDDFIEAFHFYQAKGFVEIPKTSTLRHFIKKLV